MSGATQTADLPPPSRSGRLLALIRKLIDYGTQLAATFRERPAPNDPRQLTRNFGTSDIGLILARIAQGVLRARLLGEKITTTAARIDAKPQPKPAPSSRAPRVPQPRAPRPQPNLPTPDQIAAKVRRQKIGAVLADICRDLGIPPNHPLWDELHLAINEYGGNYGRLYLGWLEQAFPIAHILARFKPKPEPHPPPPAQARP